MMFDRFSSVYSDFAEAIFGTIAFASAVAYLIQCARGWQVNREAAGVADLRDTREKFPTLSAYSLRIKAT